MASKYAEFGYFDENCAIKHVKYKIPLKIRLAEWLSAKLSKYANNALIRDRRRRYARYMKHKRK